MLVFSLAAGISILWIILTKYASFPLMNIPAFLAFEPGASDSFSSFPANKRISKSMYVNICEYFDRYTLEYAPYSLKIRSFEVKSPPTRKIENKWKSGDWQTFIAYSTTYSCCLHVIFCLLDCCKPVETNHKFKNQLAKCDAPLEFLIFNLT